MIDCEVMERNVMVLEKIVAPISGRIVAHGSDIQLWPPAATRR